MFKIPKLISRGLSDCFSLTCCSPDVLDSAWVLMDGDGKEAMEKWLRFTPDNLISFQAYTSTILFLLRLLSIYLILCRIVVARVDVR